MTLERDFYQYVGQTSDHPLAFEVQVAEGDFLYDKSGREYLDFHSGVGVMNLGHKNRVVKELVQSQLERYSHTMVYGEHVQESQVQYAKALALEFDELPLEGTLYTGTPHKQVFFANTGNEAIDLAIKMVRKDTRKKGLVALTKAFHGRGYGAMQLTWNQEYKRDFFVDDNTTDWIDPQAEDIQKELDSIDWSQKAAVFVEYVQGEAGARVIPLEFLKALRERCTQEGVYLVADEVQTGFGRTGEKFAQQTFGVTADVTCLGKAGGGGLPFGAVVAEEYLFESLETPPLSHISTFGGNPVVCSAGLGVLYQLTPLTLKESRKNAKLLEEGVEALAEKYPSVIEGLSGVGLMRGLVLKDDSLTEAFYWNCVERGLLLHFKLNAGRVLRVSPPVNVSTNSINKALHIMEESCQVLVEAS